MQSNVNLTGMVVNRDSTSYVTFSSKGGEVERSWEKLWVSLIGCSFFSCRFQITWDHLSNIVSICTSLIYGPSKFNVLFSYILWMFKLMGLAVSHNLAGLLPFLNKVFPYNGFNSWSNRLQRIGNRDIFWALSNI